MRALAGDEEGTRQEERCDWNRSRSAQDRGCRRSHKRAARRPLKENPSSELRNNRVLVRENCLFFWTIKNYFLI